MQLTLTCKAPALNASRVQQRCVLAACKHAILTHCPPMECGSGSTDAPWPLHAPLTPVSQAPRPAAGTRAACGPVRRRRREQGQPSRRSGLSTGGAAAATAACTESSCVRICFIAAGSKLTHAPLHPSLLCSQEGGGGLFGGGMGNLMENLKKAQASGGAGRYI